ncbi:hypothetical protein VTK26DRAFT_6568 [Humicola hyalothermophila]
MEPPPQPFRNHNGHGGAHHTYEECYCENGRWYGTFKKGTYMLPIDEIELERLDVFHKIFLVARGGKLYSAPIDHLPAPRILDLGCGTGIWGIDMADRFPSGTHVGLDLNYTQPEFIPANVQFRQQDIESPWQDLQPGSWDLIHMRTLYGSIAQWPRLYAEIYRHLKPGSGYLEQVEIDWTPRCDDGTLPGNSHLVRWISELFDVMDGIGRPLRFDNNLTKQRLAEAGFVDIKEEVIKLPISGWPAETHLRDVGRWFNLGMRQSYQPLSLAALCRYRNRTPREVFDLTEEVRLEVARTRVHAYCNLHVLTARKREEGPAGHPAINLGAFSHTPSLRARPRQD